MPNWGLCETTPSPTEVNGGSVFGRRTLLASALALWAGTSALAQVRASKDASGRILVTIFLRGAMDGLSLIPPTGDDEYHKARPTIRIASPIKLTDFFGLHPACGPLEPLYRDGKLAAIHAIGSLDQTRSHFEAMATMERGAAAEAASIPSGWVGRYLDLVPGESVSPLRAVAFGNVMPDILRGATTATVLQSLTDLKLDLPTASPTFPDALRKLYADGDDTITRAGRETLEVLKTMERLDPKNYKPTGGAVYPTSALGDGLKQTALLVKANVGLEVACLDRGGWDTHVTQGATIGFLALQFTDVAEALAAFAKDLGPELDRVTVVVMTEFGRRVGENTGLGTDHGRASAWLVMGGAVNGGKVYSQWPGCAPEKLEAPGDLRVTTDYRDVLTELAAWRIGRDKASTLFPGAPGQKIGIVRA